MSLGVCIYTRSDNISFLMGYTEYFNLIQKLVCFASSSLPCCFLIVLSVPFNLSPFFPLAFELMEN